MPGKLVYVARPSGMRADLPRTSVLLQQILQQIREPASSLAGNMRRACLEALLFPGKGRLCSFMIDIHVYVGSDNFVGNLFNSLVVFCDFHLVIAAFMHESVKTPLIKSGVARCCVLIQSGIS